MIEYRNIKFSTVDQLIEYQKKIGALSAPKSKKETKPSKEEMDKILDELKKNPLNIPPTRPFIDEITHMPYPGINPYPYPMDPGIVYCDSSSYPGILDKKVPARDHNNARP